MYINFWYPICTTEELTADAPVRAVLFGLRFVAFRDGDGIAQVLSDTCIHRGGSLSKGKLVDGAIACPYHGWQFGGDGKCKLIPSLEEGSKPPARAKVPRVGSSMPMGSRRMMRTHSTATLAGRSCRWEAVSPTRDLPLDSWQKSLPVPCQLEFAVEQLPSIKRGTVCSCR